MLEGLKDSIEPEEVSDIYLLAENHSVPDQADVELNISTELEPEYLVIEDSPEYKDVGELINLFHDNRTIHGSGKKFAEKHGGSFLNSNPGEIYSEALKEIDPKTADGIIPGSVEEFISLPVYELEPAIIEKIHESVKEKIHGSAISHKKSLEEGAHPDMLRDLERVDKAYRNMYKSAQNHSALIPRHFDALNPLVENGEIEVVSDTNENYGQLKNPLLAPMKPEQTKSEVIEENIKIIREREVDIGETLVKYSEKSKSPVLAIVGGVHARESSAIYPVLKSSNVSYDVINLDEDEPFRKSAEEYIEEAGSEPVPLEEYEDSSEIDFLK